MSVEVITLGCRLNIAESERMRAGLADQTDLIIINSCAVTAEAVAQTRKALRRARRDRPDARIVVTGCASEIEPDVFAGLADVVVPNAAKLELSLYRHAGLVPASTPLWGVARADGWTQEQVRGDDEVKGTRARAFVPVQNGCDHACTFCIIPQGRGANRSLPAGAVIADIERALAAGAKEIVLTGVDLTSYGADLPGKPTLGHLVERILAFVPRLARLRLSSLDPAAVDPRLEELIAGEPRLMPHVHLSLQAGDDMILKRMRRRHLRSDAIGLVARLKAARPEIAIGADLIAGFPTETAAMFESSLAILEECDIVFPHIFPYSPRAGTPAARMPQLEREVIRARAAQLREAGAVRQRRWLEAHVGTRQRVLVELDGVSGHAENFAKIQVADAHSLPSLSPFVSSEVETPFVRSRDAERAGASTSLGKIPRLRSGRTENKNRIIDVDIAQVDGDRLIGTPA